MGFQNTVNKELARGVVGEYSDVSPRRELGYKLIAQTNESEVITALPKIGCAFTLTENDGEAIIGGTGEFAGVLVCPKMYVAQAGLNPSLELPNGSQGGLCTMGHVNIVSGTAFAPGYVAAYNNATGAINAYINATNIPEGYTQIPGKFIEVSGSENGLAVLELGSFGLPAGLST